MLRRALQRIWCEMTRIWAREPWWAEVWPALGAIGWAALVYITNTSMSERPSLAVLGLLMDDNCWAALVGLIGVGQLVALFGYHQEARWIMSIFASAFWWLCVVAIYRTTAEPLDPAATPLALALYCMAALPCSYSVLRLRWDIE
jgi:hypothetical protein